MKTKRLTNAVINDITSKVTATFRSFGGGSYTPDNPISFALADSKPQFAAGVDVEDVVRFILKQAKR
jgi:hypothetical protein